MKSIPDHILKARWLWAKRTDQTVIARLPVQFMSDNDIKMAMVHLHNAGLAPHVVKNEAMYGKVIRISGDDAMKLAVQRKAAMQPAPRAPSPSM